MWRRSLALAALLPAGRRVAQLRGKPVVVNQWASWCSSCRYEFPYPTPFPHYFDPEIKIARSFGGRRACPTTAYYDATGKLTKTHVDAFATEAKLDEDTRRYALGG